MKLEQKLLISGHSMEIPAKLATSAKRGNVISTCSHHIQMDGDKKYLNNTNQVFLDLHIVGKHFTGKKRLLIS